MRSALINGPLGIAREMDRLFDSMLSTQPMGFVPAIRTQWAYPALNVWEDEENFFAEAELPGMTMDDIEVFVTENELTIKGGRNIGVPEGAQPLRRERAIGNFARTVQIPSPIDTEHVEARLVNGILAITMPKAEQYKPRRISVQTANALPDRS